MTEPIALTGIRCGVHMAAGEPAPDGQEVAVPKAARRSLGRLVLVYVAQRRDSGQISDDTARHVRQQLNDFVRHAPENPLSVRRSHVARWMARPDLSPGYRRIRLGSLRGFCQWCVINDYMRKDPTLGIAAPKVPEGVPKRLRTEEVQALVEVASLDQRTYLIVLLMLQECLRRAEVAALNVEDIDFAERTLLVRGKGGRDRHTAVLPISDETWSALTMYLMAEGHRHGPLLHNRTRGGRGLTPNTVSLLVRNAMIEAGLTYKGDRTHARTPHSCRHTGAQDMLARTHDVRSVQQALRHRSVQSTEIYLRGQVGDLRKIMAGREYTPPVDDRTGEAS